MVEKKGAKPLAGEKKGPSIEELKLSLSKLAPGDPIFFSHPLPEVVDGKTNDIKPFFKAEYKKFEGDKVTLSLTPDELKDCRIEEYKKQTFQIELNQFLAYSKASDQGVADMVEIDELNPASLLYNLMNRFKKLQIYTYVGPILLALNPFRDVPGIQGKEVIQRYKEIITTQFPLQLKKQLDPHIYALSALAYRNLKETRVRQGIVISGESGAGKTESAKIAMELLTQVAGQSADPKEDIGKKILDCNPILEGFGNAKTVRNNNSSRFGKYTLMYFGLRENKVYGARIKNYLLEKSRVVKVAATERGYHIFYFLIRGAPVELLEKLYLLGPDKKKNSPLEFNYLKTGGDLTEEHDQKGYREVTKTMTDLNFSKDEIDGIWRSLSAVLLLGEIQFDNASFDDPQAPSQPGKVKNPDRAEHVSNLLGFAKPEDFLKILLQSCVIVAKNELWTSNSLKKCEDNRDALAKQIYNNLFNWLVKRMNLTIEPAEVNNPGFGEKAKTIGLLDIFGFENFKPLFPNNYEQLCINYVNEKLHKLYIASIFEAEKMEMREEGLMDKVDQIQYPDLKVLDVIRALDFKQNSGVYFGLKFDPPAGTGIFTTIDDQCMAVLNNRVIKWEDVADQLAKDLKVSTVYKRDAKIRFKFTINHSAQNVEYEMKEFVERNVDCISPFLDNSMCEKTAAQISLIYQNKLSQQEEIEKSKVFKTIWAKFNLQMIDLMEELAEPLIKIKAPTEIEDPGKKAPISSNVEKTELHFIRCIKPRPKPEFEGDQPGLFIHSLTFQQITYMGVLESVDLKQKNFPFRKKFEDFYAEYELLSPRYATIRYYQMDKGQEDFETMAKNIMREAMKGIDDKLYALGRFKILMMPDARMVLERCKEEAAIKRNEAAAVIKKAFCLHFCTLASNKRKKNILAIQQKYKQVYAQKKIKWAEQFRQKFENAVIAFKAEKLKAFEQRAAFCIRDSLKKHTFRNHLNHAIQNKEIVVRFCYNTAKIRTLAKFMFSHMLAQRIVSNAFTRARERINGAAAWNVQRAFRGYLARSAGDRMNWVKDAIAAKKDLRMHVSAKKVQKRLKGLIVRRRLAHMNKVVSFIQSYFRMRWMRQVFVLIKKNTMILQRGVRRYMARRDMIKERMRRFLTQEFQVLENVKEMEQFQLFSDESMQVRNVTPYTIPKIFLFCRTADMQVITDLSELHSTPWSAQWMKIYKDNINTETPVMMLNVGTSHSLATTGRGKSYCWGWNDNGQCARDPLKVDEVIIKQSSKIALFSFGEEFRHPSTGELVVEKAKQMIAVEDRNFILTQDNFELYAWGSNERGQLGLGHYQDMHVPTKVDFFARQKITIKSVASGGHLTLACSQTGNAYAWPYEKAGQKFSVPVTMPFSEKIKIQRVSCGFNFGFFISAQGLVYSVGKENQDGQLGLGHRYPNDIPELIACFKEAGERIDSIECGFRHAIARSTLGKVYTWGWNAHGQLGQGHFDSELSPRLLILERGKLNKDKAIQIAAGYSHSIIMTEENRNLLWFGTSGSLNRQPFPQIMPLSDVMPNLVPESNSMVYAVGQSVDFSVVKVNCSWSKSISITNLVIADLRAVNQVMPHNKLFNSLKTLSTQWDQRDVLPPYIDVISGLFSANVMRKPASYKQTSGVKDAANKEAVRTTMTSMSKKIGQSMTQTVRTKK